MRRLVLPVLVVAAALVADARHVRADEVGLSLRMEGDRWVFVAEGTSDRASGDGLVLHLYYLKAYRVMPSPGQPGPGEIKMERVPVEEVRAVVRNGAFSAGMGRWRRDPYAGTYLLEVVPAGDDAVVATAQREIGTAERLEDQKARVREEILAEFICLRGLHRELCARCLRGAPTLSDADWRAWRETWDARLLEVERRNGTRRSAPIFTVESGGRRYIGFLIDQLRETADLATTWRHKPPALPEEKDDLEELTEYFEVLFDRYVEGLGLGPILDPVTVGRVLVRLDDVMKPVVEAARKGAPNPCEGLEAQVSSVLFELARDVGDFHIAAVVDLGKTTRALLEAVRGGDPEAMRVALEAYAAARAAVEPK